MRRIAGGDPAAVRQLATLLLPRIFGFSARILRDRAEAEDVVQEAFLRACRQAPQWETGRGRIDTWLHTVVLNLCRDRLRRRRTVLTDQVPEQADPAPDPEANLLAAERGQMVAAAVQALPERQRDAILLVHYQDLSGADAAQALGVSIEALESLLSRGRRSLREQFLKLERADD